MCVVQISTYFRFTLSFQIYVSRLCAWKSFTSTFYYSYDIVLNFNFVIYHTAYINVAGR